MTNTHTTAKIDAQRIAALAKSVEQLIDAAEAGGTAHWSDALEGLRSLEHLTQKLTRNSVTLARLDGLSWTQIGDALLVSKQAAQQRYASR